MPVPAGTRFGRYEILAPIGAGGMGEVYRARDTRLDRDVAIKILPPAFAADAERLARFEREAKTLASLNHPHIAQIHGIEDIGSSTRADGAHSGQALVMELVDGEDLAERLARGAMPLDEALAVARQLAAALDAAHERGIVHRDLKPANIRMRPDGTVKVLDFGLAKLSGTAAAAATSPTATASSTHAGVVLGTASYMSPEQAVGRPVDKRADIWAFGCVLYELLTARRAFAGETVTAIIAAVLEREPDWDALPASTPPSVRRLLRHTLARNPAARLRDIGDAMPELDAPDPAPRDRSAGPPAFWAWMAAAAAGAAVIASTGTAYVLQTGGEADAALRPMVFEIDPMDGVEAGLAISADGATIAWSGAGGDGTRRLWMRRIGAAQAIEVPGTDGANLPFLSPDGRSIGFFAGGRLKRVDLDSGAVRTLDTAPAVPTGGTWGRDDVIVFSDRFGLYRIPAAGGERTLVGSLDLSRHENSLRFPSFLPDGRHFLYVARSGRADESSAYLGSLDGPAVRLFATLAKVAYAPPNLILFVKDDTLFAQPFDLTRQRMEGTPVAVVSGVDANTIGMRASFAVSDTGVLAYGRDQARPSGSLRWRSRSGADLGLVDVPEWPDQFRIAPDGRRIAAGVPDFAAGSRSVWILAAGKPPVRFTFADTHDWEPMWSHDGSQLAFGSYRNGPLDIYVKDANGASPERPLIRSGQQKDLGDWSPDGRYVAFREVQSINYGDIRVVDVHDPTRIIDITQTPDVDERTPRFSGDGRWLAYAEFGGGGGEIVVQPFPPTGAKWQVSSAGGADPAWRADGQELYYLDRRGVLQAVAVDPRAASFRPSPARPLFTAGVTRGFSTRYDVSRDGMRFLVAVEGAAPPAVPARVIVNWPALLRSR